ncbi:MAG: ABC transporter permease, partial [Pyrinomonadaceae bacterium]
MPYELFLALRYLRPRGGGAAGRRWATARVTALVAVVGVACGVAALVVAFALANGFREELRDKILRGTAHVTLSRADGRAIEDWRQLVETVRGVPGVVDAAPTSYAGALLSGPDGEAYAVVRGVERSSGDVAEIGRTLVAGAVEPLSRMPANAGGTGVESPADVIIGVGLAGRVGLTRIGEVGWLVTGERTSSPASLF